MLRVHGRPDGVPTRRENDVGLQADQLRCECRQAFDAALCMPTFDDQVLALDVPRLVQRSQALFGAGPGAQLAHLEHLRRLLRLGDELCS